MKTIILTWPDCSQCLACKNYIENRNKELFNKSKRIFTEYYNTCPLCKWPTNECREFNWNRECIACKNEKGMWYSYSPKSPTEENIRNSSFMETLDIEIIHIDSSTRQGRDLQMQYRVMGIPTILELEDWKEVKRIPWNEALDYLSKM